MQRSRKNAIYYSLCTHCILHFFVGHIKMIHMIGLVDKDAEAAIINILHMFKKVEENMSMIRDMENMEKS